jgi:hypothetical protein
MNRCNKDAGIQVNPFGLDPAHMFVPSLKEAVTRTGAFYKGRPVKDGKEVVDYLLVELSVMLSQANNKRTRRRVDQEAIA